MKEIEDTLSRIRELDKERLEHDRASKKIKGEVDSLCAVVISAMHRAGVEEADGAKIVRKQKPFISDWAALNNYIREHDATDLLQKRLTESAVKLRWEDGVAVPGVGVMDEEKLQF